MTTITVPESNVAATIVAAVAAKLPPRARERYRKLAAAHRRAHVARQSAFDHVQSVSRQRGEVDFELAHTRRTYEDGDFEGSADEWRKRLAELQGQRDAFSAELEEAQREMQNIAAPYPLAAIDAWLASNAGRRLKTATPSVPKGDSKTALEKTRARLHDISGAIEETANARLPAKDAFERAVAEIDRVARNGMPYFARTRLVQTTESGGFNIGTVRWPTRYEDDGTPKIDAVALTVACLREQLIAMAKAECDRVAKDESGEFEPLTLAERKKRIADLKAEHLAAEYVEGALLEVLGDAATPRHDMSVAALLQVEIDRTPAPKKEPEREPDDTPEVKARDVKRARLRDPSVRSDKDDHDFG